MSDELLLRRELLAQALRLNESGLNQGTSGNLSVRFGDGLLVTPSGIPYETLTPEDLVLLRPDGSFRHHLQPSSEWRIHRDIYAHRDDVEAVVHAHPIHCTALAIHGMEIPAVHYMIAAAGGSTIRCAPYATYGTQELSDAVAVALEGRRACLLAHHGLIAVGNSLAKAMWLAIEVETLARQYVTALSIGKPPVLPDDEIARVVEKFRTYGLRTR